MSVAQEIPASTRPALKSPPRQNGRWAGYSHLLMARLLELKREPEVVFWVFVFPLLLALGLGIAFRNKPADAVPVAIVEGAGSQDAQGLLDRSRQHELFKTQVLPADEARKGFRLGKFDLVIEPDGRGGYEYRYDPARPESVRSRGEVDDALQSAAGRKDVITTESHTSSEPGSRYIDFLIPGLLGMNLMGSAIWGIGFTIVDARRKKLLKRLVASPMPRAYYLLSFLLSRILLLIVEVSVLIGFGVALFRVPLRGSWLSLSMICVLSSLCFCALGLALASRAKTIEAASGLMNIVMMPMWIASGVFFSSQKFPNVMQPFIKALPLTAVIDALRANMLQGANFAQTAPQLGIILAWLVICFALALRLFRWR